MYNDLPQTYPGELKRGDSGTPVRILQYYLEYISLFVPSVMRIEPDGFFGEMTENAVISFQQTYGLSETGIVDDIVWNSIQNTYYDILSSLDYVFEEGQTLPFPGRVLTKGMSDESVRALQEYLIYISKIYPEIPLIVADGVFGDETEAAVIAFNRRFNISTDERRVTAETWNKLTSIYEDLYLGNLVRTGQFPGYTLE